ncbi:hypothetical protein B0H14DRAFT_3139079 [Mycena olivaceomarginata]|nr:hypothetical protein B0H14DRAFT_3139079 [Mycena olivaceomarginata]
MFGLPGWEELEADAAGRPLAMIPVQLSFGRTVASSVQGLGMHLPVIPQPNISATWFFGIWFKSSISTNFMAAPLWPRISRWTPIFAWICGWLSTVKEAREKPLLELVITMWHLPVVPQPGGISATRLSEISFKSSISKNSGYLAPLWPRISRWTPIFAWTGFVFHSLDHDVVLWLTAVYFTKRFKVLERELRSLRATVRRSEDRVRESKPKSFWKKLASADRLVPGARVYFGLGVLVEVCDSRGKTTGGK